MTKAVNIFKYILLTVTALFLGVLLLCFFTVPDEIEGMSDGKTDVRQIYTLTCEQTKLSSKGMLSEGSYKVRVSLFNIPIKDSVLNISERRYVALSGELIGLRLFTEGVVIVGIDAVQTDQGSCSPGEAAGLIKGDIIYSIDGKKAESSRQVNDCIILSEGRALEIEYVRKGIHYTTRLIPAYSSTEDCYKGGLWIRDSAAGIGTLSFFDTESGTFAALGHAVCDVDTGEILPLLNGDTVKAQPVGCRKGEKGTAGELCGSFTEQSMGVIISNTSTGVFGILEQWDTQAELYPIATAGEAEKGYAQILSTVKQGEAELYDVQITKISRDDRENKNLVIEVTDERLLGITGGIVQGMSGSPILQNGRLVGVVTHVLINDPAKGYGIFIDNMLEAAG